MRRKPIIQTQRKVRTIEINLIDRYIIILTISYLSIVHPDEEPSKDDESQTKNKEIESPKEVAEKATPADGSPNNQSGRTVRRSRN